MAPRLAVSLVLALVLTGGPALAARLVWHTSVDATKKGKPKFRAELREPGSDPKAKPAAVVAISLKGHETGYEPRVLPEGAKGDLFVPDRWNAHLTLTHSDGGREYVTKWTLHDRKGKKKARAEHFEDGVRVGVDKVKLDRRGVTLTQR